MKYVWIDDREAEGTPLLREHTVLRTVSRVRIPLYPPPELCNFILDYQRFTLRSVALKAQFYCYRLKG